MAIPNARKMAEEADAKAEKEEEADEGQGSMNGI
jgi:hypothetical protein